jgi:pSer/pThr/pTyr-binding forkhead associated (FHA) protein
MATLCLLGEDGSVVQRWDLGEKPVTVGRDATADVVVPDEALSRHHFTISRSGEHYLLKDLGSQNGTSVDGRRAQEVRLHHNECVAAGRTLFLFHEHPIPAAFGVQGQPPTHDSAFLPAGLAAEHAAQRTPPHNTSSQLPG